MGEARVVVALPVAAEQWVVVLRAGGRPRLADPGTIGDAAPELYRVIAELIAGAGPASEPTALLSAGVGVEHDPSRDRAIVAAADLEDQVRCATATVLPDLRHEHPGPVGRHRGEPDHHEVATVGGDAEVHQGHLDVLDGAGAR